MSALRLTAVVLLCLGLAAVNLYIKLQVTSAWFDGALELKHQSLLAMQYFNNEQSRLLQYYIPEAIIKIAGLSAPIAYAIQRLAFTFASFVIFFLFTRKWFEDYLAVLCIIILASIMPFTYYNHTQEAAPLMSLTFLCALWAIRENRDVAYSSILLIGAINHETMLFMPALYFLVHVRWTAAVVLLALIPLGLSVATLALPLGLGFPVSRVDVVFAVLATLIAVVVAIGFWNRITACDRTHLTRLAWRTAVLALPAYGAAATIRYINLDRPHLGGAFHLFNNIAFHLDNLVLIFNVFWIIAYFGFRDKPKFLQGCLIAIPLFIIPHMITGIVAETRQMIPLGFILIPSALMYLRDRFRRTRVH